MERRALLSLPFVAIPAAAVLKPAEPVVSDRTGNTVIVDREGNILDLGGFPEESEGILQYHLDWLHDHPDYYLYMDYPILFMSGGTDQERVVGFDDDVVIVRGYEVFDRGSLEEMYVPMLQEQLEVARTEPFYDIFGNFQIRCTDPRLQARIHIFEGASSEEIDHQRKLWDTWLSESEGVPREYAV